MVGDVEGERAMAALNIGLREQRWDPDNALDVPGDEVFARLGGAYGISRDVDPIAEVETHGRFSWQEVDDRNKVALATGLVGASTDVVDDLDLRADVGAMATDGAEDPLQPGAMVMVGYRNQGPSDEDLDGLTKLEDACDEQAEDFDGYEDRDGCPDPDNDLDGLVDVSDACPLNPEDVDDYLNLDGCPDPSYAVLVDLGAAGEGPIEGGEILFLGPESGVTYGDEARLELHVGVHDPTESGTTRTIDTPACHVR